jgi:hypothetical protein
MLFLTDDGPVNCDNDTRGVRDMRTGRPPRSAQQMKRADAHLVRKVREWAQSKRRHAHDSTTSRQDTKMPRFNESALFQRSSDNRGGEAFANFVAERQMRPLDFWKKKLREGSRRVSRHAFDSAPDHQEALKHLQRIENHIETKGGTDKFDPVYLGQCFMAMLKAMGPEDEAEDDDPDLVTNPSNGGPANVRSKDGNPDHRKDFADIDQGGADSAYGFDADRLFQRGER